MDQGQLDALYQQYLGRGVDPNGAANWGGADYNTVVQGILGSQEYQNRQQQSQPQPQAQGMADAIAPSGGGDINSIYQQYLGRGVDPSGAATYAGWDPQSIINAVKGSQEYAQRQGSANGVSPVAPLPQAQGAAPGWTPQSQGMADILSPAGGDINALYQKYLGRNADQSGIATYAGWSPDQIANALVNSPEYRQSQNGANGASPAAASGNAQDLANQVFSLYRTNQNYDKLLNQLNALPQDADYYKARIGLIGQMMGWQAGQGTQGNNDVLQKELQSYLPGAQASGLNVNDIGGLINKNAQTQAQVNAERIASDAKGPKGWVNQNIPGGYTTLAAAAAIAAPYLAPELFASLGGAEGAILAGEALPYTEAFDAANLFANGITDAGQLGDILAATGMDPFLAFDMGNLAAQGLSAEQIAQVMGYSYTAPELAGTGIQSFAPGAASAATSMLSASQLANLAKGGTTIASLASKLLSNPSSKMPTSTSPSQLSKLLNPNGSTGSNQMAQSGSGSNFGLMKGNVNPFTYTKDMPVQTLATNKADPFAALNVAQTPITPYNPLAHLVG